MAPADEPNPSWRTNVTHATMLKTQKYCLAVRQQLGYPLFKPAIHCTAFASGGIADLAKGMEIAVLAETMRKDFVYTAWKDFSEKEPAQIGVALRAMLHVDWVDPCFLWAADDVAPLVIVPTRRDEHIVVGERGLLERRAGRPATALGRGKKLAAVRVRRAAATMRDELLEGNVFVPRGGTWQEPAAATCETIVRFG